MLDITLRDKAEDAIEAEVLNALRKEHERNYETLYVRRDGTVFWHGHTNRYEKLIDLDSGSDRASTIPSVVTLGTGDRSCDCEYCGSCGYASDEDAIADAVDNSDTDALLMRMQDAAADIPDGYFADEMEPREYKEERVYEDAGEREVIGRVAPLDDPYADEDDYEPVYRQPWSW